MLHKDISQSEIHRTKITWASLPSFLLLWEFKLWSHLSLSLSFSTAISSCVALGKILNFSDSLPVKSDSIIMLVSA